MRVAVIIPCYRQAHFLGEAIGSVRAQVGLHDVEVAVTVVAGSADDARAARALGLAPIVVEPRGLADARNCGIEANPHADAILPLDADDQLDPRAIAEMVSHVPARRSLYIVSSDLQEFGDRTAYWRLPPLDNASEQNPLTCASLFSRKLWEEVGGYDPTTIRMEDWDFWLHGLARDPAVVQIRLPLLRYRVHAASITQSGQGMDAVWRALIFLRHPRRYSRARLEESRRIVAMAPARVHEQIAQRAAWFPSRPSVL